MFKPRGTCSSLFCFTPAEFHVEKDVQVPASGGCNERTEIAYSLACGKHAEKIRTRKEPGVEYIVKPLIRR